MEFIVRNKMKEKQCWHLWFAWYPVCVGTTPDGDEKFVWFKNVQRCCVFADGYDNLYREVSL